jgi:hypothetical protein
MFVPVQVVVYSNAQRTSRYCYAYDSGTANKLDRSVRHIKESLGLHNCFELVSKNIFYEKHSDIGKILMPWRTCANQFMLFLKWAQVSVCSHSPDPQTYTYIIIKIYHTVKFVMHFIF